MDDLRQLAQLVTEWQKEAAMARTYGSVPQLEKSKTLRSCAAELAAALSALNQSVQR